MQAALNFISHLIFVLGFNGGADTVSLETAQNMLTAEINRVGECHEIDLKYEPNTESGFDQRLIDQSLGGQIEIDKLETLINKIKNNREINISSVQAQQIFENEIQKLRSYHDINLEELDEEEQNFINQAQNTFSEQIEMARLNKIIDNVACQIVFGCNNQVKKITNNIRKLGHVYFLKTNRQSDGFSCGFWTCFNSWSIEKSIRASNKQCLLSLEKINGFSRKLYNKLRSAENLTNYAQKHGFKYNLLDRIRIQLRQQNMLEFEEIDPLAINLGLNTLNLNQVIDFGKLYKYYTSILQENKIFVIKLYGSPEEGTSSGNIRKTISLAHMAQIRLNKLLAGLEDIDEETGEELYEHFFNSLKKDFAKFVNRNIPQAIHFVCQIDPIPPCTCPHWILISVVKLLNRKPIILICDSANWKMANYKEYQEYVELLHEQFIQPYIK